MDHILKEGWNSLHLLVGKVMFHIFRTWGHRFDCDRPPEVEFHIVIAGLLIGVNYTNLRLDFRNLPLYSLDPRTRLESSWMLFW